MRKLLFTFFLLPLLFAYVTYAQECVDCHTKVTPHIVKDWQLSKHSKNDVDCSTCHGDEHTTMTDFAKAEMPTYETCNTCHEKQVTEFLAGKHSKGWAVLNAMPTVHMMPNPLIKGKKGCGSCHIGETPKESKQLQAEGYTHGHNSCDACHTRHTFSVKEARQPQACQTCHMGFDHPQWEMYEGSKHGVRYLLKQKGLVDSDAAAPTCQTCHMPNGNHEVRTAWGFLAVTAYMPENKQWAADRVTILKALGVLDLEGKPTELLNTIKAADVVRFTKKDWQNERDKMVNTCTQCHSKSFAESELQKGDEMIKKADSLMASAIRVVADLYKDKIISKPKGYPYAYPLLLTFFDAPTPIERKLHVMFLEHRMRTFQGTFHASPDYALWYGWAEMVTDLGEIQEMAKQMRIDKQIESKN